MFFIFNKDKIMSYVVTLFTVIVLFLTASAFKDNETIQTSTNVNVNKIENVVNNEIINNNIICE